MTVIQTTETTSTITVRIDRPPVNAFTLAALDEFAAVFEALTDDPRPILICGGNGRFSAGFDVGDLSAEISDPDVAVRKARRCLELVDSHAAPVIAAVEGVAVGLGMLLALSADLVVIDRGTRLGMPEAKLGMVGDTDPLLRYLSAGWVRRLAATATIYTAGDLHLDAAGMIVVDGGVEGAAGELLNELGSMDLDVLARVKRQWSSVVTSRV